MEKLKAEIADLETKYAYLVDYLKRLENEREKIKHYAFAIKEEIISKYKKLEK